jgi:hypothetical protein
MSMAPTKATKILKEYRDNNYNAKKTLINNGYSETTATKNAGRTIETAHDTVKKSLDMPKDTSIEEVTDVLDIVGFTRDDVVKELVKVIKQDRDNTNKLKAMKPLLDTINYHLEDDNMQKSPTVSLTIEEATVKTPLQPSTEPHNPPSQE